MCIYIYIRIHIILLVDGLLGALGVPVAAQRRPVRALDKEAVTNNGNNNGSSSNDNHGRNDNDNNNNNNNV